MPIEHSWEERHLSVLRISGMLGFDEFAAIQARPADLEKFSGQKLNSLVLLDGFEGWTDTEEWGELRFVERNDAILRKIAIVGEERWRSQMEMFMLKGLRPVDIEYFGPGEESLARLWLEKE